MMGVKIAALGGPGTANAMPWLNDAALRYGMIKKTTRSLLVGIPVTMACNGSGTLRRVGIPPSTLASCLGTFIGCMSLGRPGWSRGMRSSKGGLC